MIKIDGQRNLETAERLELYPLVAIFNPHGTLDADETLGRILFHYAGRLNQKDKRTGTAVHNRHLGSTKIDIGVVDTQSGQG